MVRARIRKPVSGEAYIEIQRAKYKHWRIFGKHPESDTAFKSALRDASIEWYPRVMGEPELFG